MRREEKYGTHVSLLCTVGEVNQQVLSLTVVLSIPCHGSVLIAHSLIIVRNHWYVMSALQRDIIQGVGHVINAPLIMELRRLNVEYVVLGKF